MNKKITTYISLAIAHLAAGFALGRLTSSQIKKSEEKHLEARSEAKEIVHEQSHTKEEKKASTGSETIVRKVYYCPNGNIRSEEKIEKIVTSQNTTNKKATTASNIKNEANHEESIIQKVEYKTSWTVGAFISPINHSEINLMLGYHIIGPFSIAAQTDVQFKNPQIGIILNF